MCKVATLYSIYYIVLGSYWSDDTPVLVSVNI